MAKQTQKPSKSIDENVTETFNKITEITEKAIEPTEVVEEAPVVVEEAPVVVEEAPVVVEEAPADEEVTPPADEEVTPPADEEVTPPADEEVTPPVDEEVTPPADEEVEVTEGEIMDQIKLLLKKEHNFSFVSFGRHLKDELTESNLKLFYDEFKSSGISTTQNHYELLRLLNIYFSDEK